VSKIIYKNPGKGLPEFAMILIHGRGASADDIMSLTSALNNNEFLYAAPQAPSNTWYPYSFLSPIENNQPYLDESLDIINNLFTELNNKGIADENIILTGFSQGACLALEYAFRQPGKYGGIAALSGAVISTESIRDRQNFSGTRIFLGCSERDPHIPVERVLITKKIFTDAGADVKKVIYPGSFHGITDEEISELKLLMQKLKKL